MDGRAAAGRGARHRGATRSPHPRRHGGGAALPARRACRPCWVCPPRRCTTTASRSPSCSPAPPTRRWPGWKAGVDAVSVLAALAIRLPGAPPARSVAALRRALSPATALGRRAIPPRRARSPPERARRCSPRTARSPHWPTRSAAHRVRYTAVVWPRSATAPRCCGGCCGFSGAPRTLLRAGVSPRRGGGRGGLRRPAAPLAGDDGPSPGPSATEISHWPGRRGPRRCRPGRAPRRSAGPRTRRTAPARSR